MYDSTKIIGARVKQARSYRMLSQKDLADRINISQSNLSFIESSRHRPTSETANKLAEVLDVTIEWLEGKSSDGGVPDTDLSVIQKADRQELSKRFIECYDRLKSSGIITNDSEFADFASIPKSSLSLALSGKNSVPTHWIPFLEQKGANRDYIYHAAYPMLTISAIADPESPEAIKNSIKLLVDRIDADLKLLKSYISHIL